MIGKSRINNFKQLLRYKKPIANPTGLVRTLKLLGLNSIHELEPGTIKLIERTR